jgi:hypothetical protein
MNRYIISVLLAIFCSYSYSGLLPDPQREELLPLVLKQFWGKAKLSNGQYVQPASEAERTTLPVPKAVANRAIDIGEISGLAAWCKLDWNPNYFAMTKSARSNGFTDTQVAFVSVLHGASQGLMAKIMSKSGECSSEQQLKIKQLLNQSKTWSLNGT